MLAMGGLELDLGRHEATVDGRRRSLSALELRLLAALLDADGRVLTRDQLLDAIHGAGEGDVLDRAIDAYIKRLREKLGDDADEPRYVATVRGAGYRAADARGAAGGAAMSRRDGLSDADRCSRRWSSPGSRWRSSPSASCGSARRRSRR